MRSVKIAIGLAAIASSSGAPACSCAWFFGESDDKAIAAAAASAKTVVLGAVVARTAVTQCAPGGPRRATVEQIPIYDTLRVDWIVKGYVPASVEVRVGTVNHGPSGCLQGVNSCEVDPRPGAKGVWALSRRDSEWTFADVCTTDAVRRTYASDARLPLKAVGGEADSVRRALGPGY